MLAVGVVACVLLLVGVTLLRYCVEKRGCVSKEVDELDEKNSKSDTKN